jgi:hypothetical protein
MAEREEGIWGGEGELSRKLSYPAAQLRLPPRTGSEWGLASLLTGGLCLVICPTTLLVWASIISVHDQRWTKADVRNMCAALISCEFLVVGLVGMALAFAIVGLVASRKHETPAALPLTGLIVSAVTMIFWIVIVVSSFMTMGGLLPG